MAICNLNQSHPSITELHTVPFRHWTVHLTMFAVSSSAYFQHIGVNTPNLYSEFTLSFSKSAVLYQLCHISSKRSEEKWHNWYTTALFPQSHFRISSLCVCARVPFVLYTVYDRASRVPVVCTRRGTCWCSWCRRWCTPSTSVR